VKVFAIRLHHYREWTETLGYDREWKIQKTQAKLSFFVNLLSSRIWAFPLVTRFDNLIIISDGVRNKALSFLFNRLKKYSPVPLKGCLSFGDTLREAEENASRCVNELSPQEIWLEDYPDSKVVAVHADVDSFTEFTESTSIYTSFKRSMDVMVELQRRVYSMGGLLQYLGGDNFMMFLGENQIKNLLSEIPEGLKLGIGICNNPRCAVARSTEALTRIRESRDSRWKLVDV
jgi:GTP cyclohydrolase IIa